MEPFFRCWIPLHLLLRQTNSTTGIIKVSFSYLEKEFKKIKKNSNLTSRTFSVDFLAQPPHSLSAGQGWSVFGCQNAPGDCTQSAPLLSRSIDLLSPVFLIFLWVCSLTSSSDDSPKLLLIWLTWPPHFPLLLLLLLPSWNVMM